MTTPVLKLGLTTSNRNTMLAAGAPTASPAMVPNPVNLVRASRIPTDDTNGRWVNGFTYLPEGIGELGVGDACSGDYVEMVTANAFTSSWYPYILTAEYTCSTFGYAENDYKGRVTRLLDAATPKLLEWEFWGGPLSQAAGLDNPFLEEITPAHAATTIEDAFGYIENLLGDCAYGGRGMIHCPPYVVPYIGTFTRREGNLLLTARDTIVVPGSGYARYAASGGVGSPPVNPSIDIYGTGITDVRLGDILADDEGTLDRASNTVVIKAQRYACVSWDELCKAKVTVTKA